MTARDELEEELHSFGSTLEGAVRITERILAEHAHELAEKIRAESCGYGCEYTFANLIDPEVDK